MGNKQASEALLKGINYAIENKLNKAPMDKTFTGVVKNVKEDNTYDVLIQGKIYTNIPSIFKRLKINETVKVKVPQNQYSQMYIEGKYNMKTDVPETLPNPFSLIFNGAVNAEYDGSKEITVTIPSGGEAGTSNYNDLINKPSINDITLEGNKTLEELNIQPKGNYLTKEEDPTVPQYVKKISELDIDNWNNKSNFSGDYNDLQNKPTIPTKTSELTNDSNFVSDTNYVHTDNNYTTTEKDKLSGIQNGAEVNVQSDWNETDSSSDSYVKNKPIIPSVPEYTIEEVSATSGYLKTYQLKKDSSYIGAKINIPKDMVVSSGTVETVKETGIPYEGAVIGDKYIDLIIANSASSHIYIPVKDLVDVYTAGTSISVSSSNVISVISDTELSETSVNPVQNKVIKNALDDKLSTTGNASNVTNTFTEASTRVNLTTGEKLSISLGKIMKWFSDLKNVAFSGSYNDLSNKPTIPTVNNGTLTIQKNGASVGTFTANSSSNVTANIIVPTKTSELTNDSGFKTIDTNTTYSLSKSGSEIILTGSDGKITKVTDSDTKYSQATSSVLGLVKIGYTENGKNYPVELSNGQMFVNVPWTDTNTTYELANTTSNGLLKQLTGNTSQFMRGDGTWATPPNTIYGVATSSALGLVKSGTDITVDSSGNVSVVGGDVNTATKLQTARKIAGTSFDGTQDISISYNNLTDKPTIPSGVQVIDNLTSSSTTASLSANQGRILKGDIDKKVVVSSTQPSGQQTGDTWYQII